MAITRSRADRVKNAIRDESSNTNLDRMTPRRRPWRTTVGMLMSVAVAHCGAFQETSTADDGAVAQAQDELAEAACTEVCGDLDGNGSVAVTDGVKALRFAAGLDNPTECALLASDADGDGKVSVTDGVLILRAAADLPGALTCPGLTGSTTLTASSVVAGMLERTCFQFGYAPETFSSALGYYNSRFAALGDSKSATEKNTQIEGELKSQHSDQFTCRPSSESLAKRVKHVTKDRAQIPSSMGAAFLSNNWLLTPSGNEAHYLYQDARGPVAVSARLGIETFRFGLGIKGHRYLANPGDSETVEQALPNIHGARLAGLRTLWPVFYMKEDHCCAASPSDPNNYMPDSIRGGPQGTPVTDADVYSRVEAYGRQTMGDLLAGAELPIQVVQIGNEIDGGIWFDFDANPANYGGPPLHPERTAGILKAVKRGITQAYADLGLGAPYFQIQFMPDTYQTDDQIKSNIQDILTTSGQSNGFDSLSFSYYSGARGNLDPLAYAEKMRRIADSFGLPWGVSELGVPQDLASGSNGWNAFANTAECTSLLGSPCSSLADMQGKVFTRVHEIFRTSPNFFGSMYLAPQANIASSNLGADHTLDLYRIGLWMHESYVSSQPSTVAEIAPAFYSLRDTNTQLSEPIIQDVGSNCADPNNCLAWFWGKNFRPNVRVGYVDPVTGATRYLYNHQLNFETVSVVSFTLPPEDAAKFRDHGMSFFAVNPGTYRNDVPSETVFASAH